MARVKTGLKAEALGRLVTGEAAAGVLGEWIGPEGPQRRRSLRAQMRAGELEELEFEAVVYRAGPNRNHVRFGADALPGFAASFVGQPFLRNHDVQDVGSRDGVVTASAMVGDEMRQTVRLTTQRGMRDFLDSVLDRFSIGWFFDGVRCSVCGEDWLRCAHTPGQEYEGQVCEVEFVNPQGKETSAVNAPAVAGTGVIRQLALLKEADMGMEGAEAEVREAEDLTQRRKGAKAQRQ